MAYMQVITNQTYDNEDSFDASSSKYMLLPLNHSAWSRPWPLTSDLWPWKPFHQRPLTWWTFVASFMEIPPLSTAKKYEIGEKQTTDNRETNGQWTDRQTDRQTVDNKETSRQWTDRQTGKHNVSAIHCGWRHKNTEMYALNTWVPCRVVINQWLKYILY